MKAPQLQLRHAIRRRVRGNPRVTPKDETRSGLTDSLHITAEQSACLAIGEQVAEIDESSTRFS
jgi:hypothetical protein